MKVLVVLTGGTVSAGLTTVGKGVSVTNNDMLIAQKYPLFTFETFKLQLSENLTTSYLAQLYHYVDKINSQNFSKVYVLHGTDTLTYTAEFINRTIKPKQPIFFISTQRSPDNPNWQLPAILDILEDERFSNIEPRSYIINYKSPSSIELLDPRHTIKFKSFAKGCFKNYYGPQYIYEQGHLKRIKNFKRYYIHFKGFKKAIPVFYVTPDFTLQYLHPVCKQIILVGYGLGNLPNSILKQIECYKELTFYVTNNLEGPKSKIVYSSHLPANVIVSNETIEGLYLSLLLK